MIELNLYNTMDCSNSQLVSVNPLHISCMVEINGYDQVVKEKLFENNNHSSCSNCRPHVNMPSFSNSQVTLINVSGINFVYDGPKYQLQQEIDTYVDNEYKSYMLTMLNRLKLG